MKHPLFSLLSLVLTFGLGSLAHAGEPRPSPAAPATTPVQSAPAQAADDASPAVATIDMKKIFETHPKTKEAEGKINVDRNAAKKEMNDRLEKRRQLFEEIRKLDHSLASGKLAVTGQGQADWMRSAKTTALQALDGQIREYQAAREKGLQDTAMRMRDGIVDEINKAIAAAPSLSAFTFLLDRSGSTTNGVPLVVYSHPNLDRSGGVQKQLGVAGADDAPDAHAGPDLNLATLDMKKIFGGYSKSKEAEDEIAAARAAAKKDIDDHAAAYTSAADALKAIDAELASATLVGSPRKAKTKERAAKAAEMEKIEKETNELQAAHDKELQETSTRLRAAILDDINKAVLDGVKAEGHVDLILDASGPSLNGIPVVVHRDGVPDWTESVVTALNDSKAGAKKTPNGPANSSISTRGLRFAVVDLKRVFEATPSTKAAEKALDDARTKTKPGRATEEDAKAKEKELEAVAIKKRGEIVEKMKKALTERGAKPGYHLVLDSSGKSLSGVPVVTARDAVPDLTEEMIAALGTKTK